MYVCICQSVTDRQIHQAVRDGVLTFERLRMELRVATCCGCCHDHVREVFHQALREQLPAMPLRAIVADPPAA